MSIGIPPITHRDILPAYPGYAIGNLIRKSALLKPDLLDRQKKLTEILEDKLKQHKEIKERYKDLEIQQIQINASSSVLKETRNEIRQVDAKIKELNLIDAHLGPRFEETLPIDPASRMIIDGRSFASLKMHSLTIKKSDKTDSVIANLLAVIYSDKTANEVKECLTPNDTLSRFMLTIEQMLEKEGELSLIGAFVTLTRVRRMDPIIIRRNAIGDKLKSQADKYYVLTEAVLGAVFLGVGSHLSASGDAGLTEEKKENRTKASASLINFISQGAIPDAPNKPEDVNLLSVYNQWIAALKQDQSTGYPIGFRYRELQDVLRENGIRFTLENIPNPSPLIPLSPQKEDEIKTEAIK